MHFEGRFWQNFGQKRTAKSKLVLWIFWKM